MADKWQLIHPNHINAIVDGYEATIEHFRDRVGFTLDRRIPDSGDGTDACLMTLGGVMFEFFAPKERGERGQGRLLARYGDHCVGIEYHVPDVTDGPLADYLGRYGQRIRSTVFKAGNVTAVEKHLTAQGFDLISGDADGVLAINPAQNKVARGSAVHAAVSRSLSWRVQ
jgi:Glyoxalase-like domain